MRVICHGIRNPRGLKLIRYAACLVDLNEYLAVFPGVTITEIFCVTELDKNLLTSIPNSCSNQAYVQGFDCEYISFKSVYHI